MTNENKEIGKKYDGGKPDWSLVPLDVIEEVAKVLSFGAQKYGAWNWMNLDNGRERYFAALMRHLTAYQSGESTDKESGLSHLSHCLTNLVFLSYFEKHK